MPANEIHVNDVGTLFTLTIKDGDSAVNISSATTKKIIIKKPSGTKLTYNTAFVSDGTDGKMQVFDRVADMADRWAGTENVGLVAGATFPDDLRSLRSRHPEPHFLIPGVGAQGGDAEETARAGANSRNGGFVINSSRGIIYASSNPEDFDIEARKAAELLRDQVNEALKPNGITPQTVTLE